MDIDNLAEYKEKFNIFFIKVSVFPEIGMNNSQLLS